MSVLRPPGFTPDSNETMAKLLRSWEAELPKGELKAFRRRVAEPKQAIPPRTQCERREEWRGRLRDRLE